MARSSLFWGIVLIALGGMFLLNTMGILDFNIWQIVGPGFLVLFGLWILLGAGGSKTGETEESVALKSTSEAEIRFDYGAGRLMIGPGASEGNLLEGKFGGGLVKDVSYLEGRLLAHLKMPSINFPIFFPWGGLNWQIKLSEKSLLSMDLNVGAAETTIDLQDLQVKQFKLSTGASSTSLTLPSKPKDSRFVIKSGLASVDVRIPQGVSARIKGTVGLGAINVNQNRFHRLGGGEYKSPDYDTAEFRVDLVVETGLAAVDIH